MAGSWSVKPLFTNLSLNAWAFWIVMFVMVITFFAFIRIIYLICLKKLKKQTITAIDLNDDITNNSTQAIYASVIAPNYFYNNGQTFNESVNAMNEESNKSVKYFEKLMKRNETIDETIDGVDSVSESCESKTIAIRPLTPAYKPHQNIPKEDPLGFLLVPPGFVSNLANNTHFRIERNTHSA